MTLLRDAYYRAWPLSDHRNHCIPREAIQKLMGHGDALPTGLEGRPCWIEIWFIQHDLVLGHLRARIFRPHTGDELHCSPEAFPDYPDHLPPETFLLVKIILLEAMAQ